ncbi:unnamed protein product [Paramecium primaurelia]|uniref:CWF21 domain-containing protein n=1 Tax=Paramecium primaurelia TaxID=5886 RepID=A0A8S1N7E3_PARPR|nr:unnamed protein product [Paramecium primaurelia]
MYNNIGLMTPRGSGTSGYVQKNLAHIKPTRKQDEFLKEIKAMKENVIQARKKANPDIILHEMKRDIELKKLTLQEELEARGIAEDEIKQRVQRLEEKLKDMLNKGEYQLDHVADTHVKTQRKEEQERKIGDAFGIDKEQFKPGTAFDFDAEEKTRLEKKVEREMRKAERLIQLKEQKKAEKKRLKELAQQEQQIKDAQEKDVKKEESRSRSRRKEKKSKKHKK